MSTSKESNFIKIIYILKDEENLLNFDPEETFLLFKFCISNNSKINLDDYEIVYEEKNLNENYEKMKLKDLIHKNKFPIFHLKLKQKNNDSVNYKPKGIKEIYKNIVQLENFPSRPEIFSYFESFLVNHNIKDGYYYLVEASILKIYFKNLEVAYSFMKVMMDRKYNNPLYERLKVYLFIEDLISKVKPESKDNNDSFMKEHSSIMNEYKLEKNKFHSVKPKKVKPNLVLKIYDPSLQNSSPYISDAERQRKEYIENRKKWLGNDFCGCIKSNKIPRFIENYVNLSPSISPLHYKFREINRNKWIKGSDFIL